jgi:hypothetical protein
LHLTDPAIGQPAWRTPLPDGNHVHGGDDPAPRDDPMTPDIRTQSTTRAGTWQQTLGLVVAWAWTILAAGGGAMLLIERGPWPMTNGWFALLSGLAACPGTAWLAQRRFGIAIPGRARFVSAALIWVAGHVARAAGL